MLQATRPEAELLLSCAAPDATVGHAERVRALTGQALDWDWLLGFAAAHAVTPLLYWRLKAVRPEVIPPALAESFHENTRNSIRLTGTLLHLLDLFTREGIRVLPFKGPALAAAAYGNLALRQFCDLDLLVERHDALRARDTLLRQGYRLNLPLSPRREAAYLRAYDEFALSGPQGGPLVELHWDLTPRYFSVAVDIRALWERAASITLGNREAPALSAEDMLLGLCIHGAKHCWSQLRMIADIAWFVARSDIRWDAVLERARDLGCLRILSLGMNLAHQILGITLLPEISPKIYSDRAAQLLTAEVKLRILQPHASNHTIFSAALFHVRARERWLDRFRYLIRLAATTSVEDWELTDLPPPLTFVYSLLRVPRLLWKYRMRIP